MEFVKIYLFVTILPALAIFGLLNKTERVLTSNQDFDLETKDGVRKIPRIVRVFGDFMKNTKTNIEGRIYASYHNQHCALRRSLCKIV